MDRKEHIARNEALFREINERVREVRPEEGDNVVGFLCECGVESWRRSRLTRAASRTTR